MQRNVKWWKHIIFIIREYNHNWSEKTNMEDKTRDVRDEDREHVEFIFAITTIFNYTLKINT